VALNFKAYNFFWTKSSWIRLVDLVYGSPKKYSSLRLNGVDI